MRVVIGFLALVLWGCSSPKGIILKVAASPTPHAEMLQACIPALKAEGITLKILEVEDYHLPNCYLKEGEVDANFFQHIPFLKEQEKALGTSFSILARVHLEPLGAYSSRWSCLEELPQGATIALPSDPSNEKRSLSLLALHGVICLSGGGETPLDLAQNPSSFRFLELDPPLLARALKEVDLALIPAHFALQAGLRPTQEALLLEEVKDSPYVNVLVCRKGEESRPELTALARALTAPSLAQEFEERTHGEITFSSSNLN